MQKSGVLPALANAHTMENSTKTAPDAFLKNVISKLLAKIWFQTYARGCLAGTRSANMVQTRRQTRMGATAPPPTHPFSNAIQTNIIINPPKRRRRECQAHQSRSNTPEPPQKGENSDRSNDSQTLSSQTQVH